MTRFGNLAIRSAVVVALLLSPSSQALAASTATPKAGDACTAEQYGVEREQPGGRVLICRRATRKWALYTPAQPLPRVDAGAIALNKTVYVHGTRLDVTSVAAAAGEITVKARATNENIGEPAFQDILQRTGVTIEGADSVRASLLVTDVPPTPAGTSSTLVWTGRAPEGLDLATARLVFGATTENQSFLPIGPGAATTFVPKIGFGVKTTWASPTMRVEILDSKLRAAYRNEAKGTYLLDLKVRLTGLTRTPGGTFVAIAQFEITSPSGRKVRADYDGSQDVSPLGDVVNQNTRADGWLRFAIDETKGTFNLTYTEPTRPPVSAKLVIK